MVLFGPAAALGSRVCDGRFDGYNGPGLIAPKTSPQVFGVRHGAAVQQRTFHERRGVLQRSGLARRQSRQAAVAQGERGTLVETEITVRRNRFFLLSARPRNKTSIVISNVEDIFPRTFTGHVPFASCAHARDARNGSHEYHESEQDRQQFKRRVEAQRIFHDHVVVGFRYTRKSDKLQRSEGVIDFVLVVQH